MTITSSLLRLLIAVLMFAEYLVWSSHIVASLVTQYAGLAEIGFFLFLLGMGGILVGFVALFVVLQL